MGFESGVVAQSSTKRNAWSYPKGWYVRKSKSCAGFGGGCGIPSKFDIFGTAVSREVVRDWVGSGTEGYEGNAEGAQRYQWRLHCSLFITHYSLLIANSEQSRLP